MSRDGEMTRGYIGSVKLLVATMAAMLTCTSAPAGAQDGPERDASSDWWGYLHAQCWQEPVTWELRNICETDAGEEPGLAVIVSSIVRFDSKSFDPHGAFTEEVKRLHGLDMEGRAVMPFATWQEAEKAQYDSLRAARRLEGGQGGLPGCIAEAGAVG